jgi:hypothetical protein
MLPAVKNLKKSFIIEIKNQLMLIFMAVNCSVMLNEIVSRLAVCRGRTAAKCFEKKSIQIVGRFASGRQF